MRGQRSARDSGFTLVEVIMAVVLSSIIAGVTVAVMISSINVVDTTRDLSRDSTDTGLIAAFLYRDAQAAGGTDPATLARDPSLGVSTTDWGGCEQRDGELVVRFAWVDRADVAAEHPMTVTWARFDDGRLVRRACQDDAVVEGAIGEHVGKIALTCQPGPACDATTTGITLDVRGSAERTATTVTLTASMRPDLASLATGGSGPEGPSSPLVLVGGAGACPELSLGGVRTVVLGDVLVDDACGEKAVDGDRGSLQPSGALTPVSALRDPYAELVPDPVGCAGLPAAPSGTIVHTKAVTFTGSTTLPAGRHVFCQGATVGDGAVVRGTDVFLQVVSGNVTVAAGADVEIVAARTGPFRNLLVSLSGGKLTFTSGTSHDVLDGVVHAPDSTVELAADSSVAVGAIIADRLDVWGGGVVRIGTPIPTVTMEPTTMPTGQVGVTYTPTSLLASGGTAPYRWVASNLPSGLALTTGGLLTGSPTTAGTTTATFTVEDATGFVEQFQRSITVRAALAIASPSTIPNGQPGVAYPSTTITATGGTTPYAFSATGLPTGLTISGNGVISGTPTVTGDFTVVARVTDAAGASATRSFTMSVRAALSIASPASLPNGTVGVAYTSTSVTAAGGTSPYSFSASGLPAGLTMSSNGVISGTPSASGTVNATVTVTDAAATTATRVYTVTIATPTTTASAKPFSTARGFQIFVEGNTTLATWEIEGAVATGGNLTFRNFQRIASQDVSTLTVHKGGEPLGLLVGGRVDLTASGTDAELTVDRGWFVVGSATGQSFLKFGNELHLVPAGVKDDWSTPRLLSQDKQSDLATSEAVKPNAFNFATAFTTLRTTSDRIEALDPAACAGVRFVQITSQYGNHQMTVTAGAVNVWNVKVAELEAITNMTANMVIRDNTKLVINVLDAGSITLPVRYWDAIRDSNSMTSVMWNFPNATSVAITQNFDGSLLAPYAAVTMTDVNITGNVVAKSLNYSAWSTKLYPFDGTIPCIG